VLRSYLREAREALEGLGPEGGSPEERVLRDVREQAALGLAADAGTGAGHRVAARDNRTQVGFVFLLEAEGADATGHPVFRRIVRAKRALDAALALEAPAHGVAAPAAPALAPALAAEGAYAAAEARRAAKRARSAHEVAPRYGGWRDAAEAPVGDRRAASRAVVDNKGLAPHRPSKAVGKSATESGFRDPSHQFSSKLLRDAEGHPSTRVGEVQSKRSYLDACQ